MNIISLFAGAGGLDRGFENAGFNVIWANEYDRNIWETYRLNHPHNQLDTRSITQVEAGDIPDFGADGEPVIGMIGGPPCQSWSLAGAMRGLEDNRGQLFLDYLRILREKRPLFFVAENVPGMLSPTHIDAFNNIKEMFRESGYNVNHQLLNANDYGVPQERKRVILVGFRNDLGIEFDFNRVQKVEPRLVLRDAFQGLPEPLPALEKNKTNGEALNFANNEYFIGDFSSIFMSRNRRRTWEEASFTIQAGARHAPIHPASCPMEKLEANKWRFTSDQYRRLSVRECARVQTFPDDFEFRYTNLADGYKMIGNAVPVKLAEAIAVAIRETLRHIIEQ